jgi:16S rRNA processing protein RimM
MLKSVWLDVDVPEYYDGLDAVFLEVKNELVPFIIQELQIRGKKSIAKFEDINKIEQTEAIVGCEIYLPLKKLPKLTGNQFYYHEVIGYMLFDKNNDKEIGVLKAVYESSGQDLFAVNIEEIEILIPIVAEFIVAIDHPNKKITLKLPDGLLEVYLNN